MHSVPFQVSSKHSDCHILLRHNNALSKILERKALVKLFTSFTKMLKAFQTELANTYVLSNCYHFSRQHPDLKSQPPIKLVSSTMTWSSMKNAMDAIASYVFFRSLALLISRLTIFFRLKPGQMQNH